MHKIQGFAPGVNRILYLICVFIFLSMLCRHVFVSRELNAFFLSIADFVCSEDLLFLSACHAGCANIIEENVYGNCSCLPSPEKVLKTGICNNNCNYIILAVILFFQVLLTFTGTIPGLVAGLR